MRFRPADDLALVSSLAHAIWHEYYPRILSTEQIDYMLHAGYSREALKTQQQSGVEFIIVDDGMVDNAIGFLGFGPDTAPGVYKLHKLYLRAETRGKGVGQRALAYVEDRCRALGAHHLVLNVNKHNALAMRAYQRAGYTCEAEVVIDIGGGFVMDDYVYGKAL